METYVQDPWTWQHLIAFYRRWPVSIQLLANAPALADFQVYHALPVWARVPHGWATAIQYDTPHGQALAVALAASPRITITTTNSDLILSNRQGQVVWAAPAAMNGDLPGAWMMGAGCVVSDLVAGHTICRMP